MKVTGFDNTEIGTKTITVSYEGKTTTFTVEIVAKSATEIIIKEVPTKVTYKQYIEQIDLSGGIITVKYNDETEEEKTMNSEGVTATGFNNTILGIKEITITYEGKSDKFNIEIIQRISYIDNADRNEIKIGRAHV